MAAIYMLYISSLSVLRESEDTFTQKQFMRFLL